MLTRSPTGIRAGPEYSVVLNDMGSVRLKGTPGLFLVAGQTIRVAEQIQLAAQQRYAVQTVSYTYGFSLGGGKLQQELLTFHWNRDESPPPRGHIHIGVGLLARPTPIRPRDFNHAHIPTGYVPFTDVVRFAIAELGVTPLVEDWEAILSSPEES